jgi:ubiquinone/menaquinone biosynthesis C-methylase UbiE
VSPQISVAAGTVYHVPFEDDAFDLVLTSGVLIHVPLAELDAAISEVHRVSRRYILSIEYFAEEETTIDYRGHDNLLWKRDFGAHYHRLFPALNLVGTGDLTAADGFDQARWWLFRQ